VIAVLGQLRTLLQIFPQGLEGGKVTLSALSIFRSTRYKKMKVLLFNHPFQACIMDFYLAVLLLDKTDGDCLLFEQTVS